MILRYKDIVSAIEIKSATILLIENKNLLKELILSLYYYDDNVKIFDNSVAIDLNKNMLFFKSFFEIDINNNLLLKELYSDLEREIEEIYYNDYIDINIHLNKFFNKLSISNQNDIQFDDHLSVKQLLKMANVRFADNIQPINFNDRILNILKLIDCYLANIKLVTFYNVLSLLSKDESISLLNEIDNLKIKVLFIETCNNIEINHEKIYIIDSDLCEIHSH